MNNPYETAFFWCIGAIMILSGCAGKRNLPSTTEPQTAQDWTHHYFDTSGVHSGLYMVEAGTSQDQTVPLIDYNSTSLFTPASNTKILTLYAALKMLPDQLHGIQWIKKNDTTFLRGMGDPGFLDPRFESLPTVKFLKQQDKLVFVSDWTSSSRWGPGWSWDDYPYYFAAQKSPFPVYGNVARAWCKEGTWTIRPDGFTLNKLTYPQSFSIKRNESKNIFQVNSSHCSGDTTHIPFVWTPEIAASLLSDTLHMPIQTIKSLPENTETEWAILSGTNRDTLLRSMMYESDNLIAEQLLMNASATHWNSLNSKRVIDSLMSTEFQNWAGKIRWVDGSGLSIYNKVTPRFLCEILSRLYESMPQKQVLRFFAAGGERGTISSWYSSDTNFPYIYAKTGTLTGVHCLSGYLIADSGKTFIFSFMHNNYLGSSNQYKLKMEKLLQWIKERH